MEDVAKEEHLFDVVIVVGLKSNGDGKVLPFITYRFPESKRDDQIIKSITEFCFPDLAEVVRKAKKKKNKSEPFSFVLTEGTGEKRWGYCKRVFSKQVASSLHCNNGMDCQVLCFCIVSFIPCFKIFSEILSEMMVRRTSPSVLDEWTIFLDKIYTKPLPEPGGTLVVSVPNLSGFGESNATYAFQRPEDSESLLDHVNFEPLLRYLDPKSVVAIFASLLAERRIVFTADRLSTLSSCVQAAVAVLYPFTWQHIFIPVLPSSLLTFICAPMPFVVGILKSSMEEVSMMRKRGDVDEIILVDIEENRIEIPVGINDYALLPANYRAKLEMIVEKTCKAVKAKYSLWGLTTKKRRAAIGGKAQTEKLKARKGEMTKVDTKDFANGFIAFMIDILWGYKEYIIENAPPPEPGKKVVNFNKEEYLQQKPPEIRKLLDLITESQMFEMFIQDRIARVRSDNSTFDARMTQYGTRKKKAALTRFTLYEQGEITREDITRSTAEEELYKAYLSPVLLGVKKPLEAKKLSPIDLILQERDIRRSSTTTTPPPTLPSQVPHYATMRPTGSKSQETERQAATMRPTQKQNRLAGLLPSIDDSISKRSSFPPRADVPNRSVSSGLLKREATHPVPTKQQSTLEKRHQYRRSQSSREHRQSATAKNIATLRQTPLPPTPTSSSPLPPIPSHPSPKLKSLPAPPQRVGSPPNRVVSTYTNDHSRLNGSGSQPPYWHNNTTSSQRSVSNYSSNNKIVNQDTVNFPRPNFPPPPAPSVALKPSQLGMSPPVPQKPGSPLGHQQKPAAPQRPTLPPKSIMDSLGYNNGTSKNTPSPQLRLNFPITNRYSRSKSHEVIPSGCTNYPLPVVDTTHNTKPKPAVPFRPPNIPASLQNSLHNSVEDSNMRGRGGWHRPYRGGPRGLPPVGRSATLRPSGRQKQVPMNNHSAIDQRSSRHKSLAPELVGNYTTRPQPVLFRSDDTSSLPRGGDHDPGMINSVRERRQAKLITAEEMLGHLGKSASDPGIH